jgi:hypothetical protein
MQELIQANSAMLSSNTASGFGTSTSSSFVTLTAETRALTSCSFSFAASGVVPLAAAK